jgi:shikimate kinase
MAGDRLILIGFMGMGKTTVGPRVAGELGVAYYDTDVWMQNAGVDVPTVVSTDEKYFRGIEALTLDTILRKEPGVISTGGGIVSSIVGRNALTGSGVPIVLLDASFEVAAEHVRNDPNSSRPLFDERARERYEARLGWYHELAHYVVDASQSIDQVVADIVGFSQSQS